MFLSSPAMMSCCALNEAFSIENTTLKKQKVAIQAKQQQLLPNCLLFLKIAPAKKCQNYAFIIYLAQV